MRRVLLLAAALFLAGCAGSTESAPLDTQLGGDTTRNGPANNNALGFPAANLPGDQRATFELGDSLFTQNWVIAPSSTDTRDGLGPTFNAQACASCHVKDGRGQPPTLATDSASNGLLLRLSIPGKTEHGAPVPDAVYGAQLQDKAIPGVPAEGNIGITYAEQPGTYGDGSAYSLRAPTYSILNPAFGPPSSELMIGPRLAPQVIGMGLLQSIPASTIEDNADPDDKNNDGISGRPNYVFDQKTNADLIGRFGWKANEPTVAQQTAGAFHGDIGITSPLALDEECSLVQTACNEANNGGKPEIDERRLGTVVFYSSVLAVPAMRDVAEPDVKDGAKQFVQMQCAACHTPTVKTGDAEIASLANQTIHPYTDLLLHDMGPGLADGRPDFKASGSEWRTPPLWGLGLTDDINGHRYLLHDGRARSFEEAILWHGGEGASSAEAFRTASPQQRAALLAYLEAL